MADKKLTGWEVLKVFGGLAEKVGEDLEEIEDNGGEAQLTKSYILSLAVKILTELMTESED